MKKGLLVAAMVIGTFCSFAQIAPNAGSSESFKFSQGAKDWSEPQKVDINGTSLSVRIRLHSKVMLSCVYDVEITNLTSKKISFQISTGWKDLFGQPQKSAMAKFNLKPNATDTQSVSWQSLKNSPKDADGCITCTWALNYSKLKAK